MKSNLFILISGMIIVGCFQGSALGCPTPKVKALSVMKWFNTEAIRLTITGSRFNRSTSVKFMKPGEVDILAGEVKVLSRTQLNCVIDLKGKAAGKWDVVIFNTGEFFKKGKPAVIPGGFTIENPVPVVTGVEPNQGLNNSIVNLLIGGIYLRTGARVMLSKGQIRIGASEVTVLSDTQVECEVNLRGAESGTYDLKIVNDDGQSGILAHSFTVAE